MLTFETFEADLAEDFRMRNEVVAFLIRKGLSLQEVQICESYKPHSVDSKGTVVQTLQITVYYKSQR